MRGLLAAVLSSAILLPINPVLAQNNLDRRVMIHNGADEPIFFLYGSNEGTDSWEEDILGDDVLMPGSSVRVNFDDRSGYCIFDFKAKFESGREATQYGLNVCELASYTFH